MDKSKFGERQGENLDPQYKNGQSDAEKLMTDHLQSSEDTLPDDTLNAIRTTAEEMPATPTAALDPETPNTRNDEEDDSTGTDRVITPLDVLGS